MTDEPWDFGGKRDPGADDAELLLVERAIGFALPTTLSAMYRYSNGGWPACELVDIPDMELSINKIFAPTGENSVLLTNDRVWHDNYPDIPRWLVPFGEDDGADPNLVDLRSADGDVYLFRHDSDMLVPEQLGVNLREFFRWFRMRPEEEYDD